MDFTWAADGAAHASAARRRRERRLSAYLRYARMSVAVALAEAARHTAPRGQKTARARGEKRDELYDAKGLMTRPPSRPTPLVEVRPQGRVQRHFLEHMADICPYVQILDAPVPPMVENVTDTFPIAEQVIDVPKVSCSPCPSASRVPEPQSAEQLVEVPTVLSPTRIALLIAEQIVDTPVPCGCDQGFLALQSSTASHSSGKCISERILEQIVDFSEQTVEQIVDTSPGVGLGQGSSSSRRGFYSGFSQFSQWENKCACRRESECGAAPGGQLMDSSGL